MGGKQKRETGKREKIGRETVQRDLMAANKIQDSRIKRRE